MLMNHSRITDLLQRARGHQQLQNQLALWQCVYQAQQNNGPWLVDLSCTRQPRHHVASPRVTMTCVDDERRTIHPINSLPCLSPIVIP